MVSILSFYPGRADKECRCNGRRLHHTTSGLSNTHLLLKRQTHARELFELGLVLLLCPQRVRCHCATTCQSAYPGEYRWVGFRVRTGARGGKRSDGRRWPVGLSRGAGPSNNSFPTPSRLRPSHSHRLLVVALARAFFISSSILVCRCASRFSRRSSCWRRPTIESRAVSRVSLRPPNQFIQDDIVGLVVRACVCVGAGEGGGRGEDECGGVESSTVRSRSRWMDDERFVGHPASRHGPDSARLIHYAGWCAVRLTRHGNLIPSPPPTQRASVVDFRK